MQLYHSIHARGEDVNEALNRAEREDADGAASDIEKDDESMDIEGDAGKAATQAEEQARTCIYSKPDCFTNAITLQDIAADESSSSNVRNAVPPTPGAGGAPSVPDALLGQGKLYIYKYNTSLLVD